MPMLIEHIDKMARIKQRDVVCVSFEPDNNDSFLKAPNHTYFNWETDSNRTAFIEWLNTNNIKHECIGHFASESGFLSYNGNIYVDVPFDTADLNYKLVSEYLENADGTPKNPVVKFWVLSLEEAMKNAHHDEPGFWDKWAEDFV